MSEKKSAPRGPQQRAAANVDEEYKIHIAKRINDFRDSDEQVLVFPKGLDNQERKYVHEICLKLGLSSKSTGMGDNRYLTVRKPLESKAINERLPLLTLSRSCLTELTNYFASFPIAQEEELYVMGQSTVPFLRDKAVTRRKSTIRRPAVPFAAKSSIVPDVIDGRKKLPIWAHKDEIIEVIRRSAVTIVSGETGSGKSTQTVQFVLDSVPGSKIVCTQPRRLSAIALAERVAEERSTASGHEIGYSVRFESEYDAVQSRCIFCTTGVALSALREGLDNSSLTAGVTHIFVDEVHERDRNTDFLLIFVKELLLAQSRHDWRGSRIKVVLMSATINVQTFATYFTDQARDLSCSVVAVEGSAFKVQPLFLEDALALCPDLAARHLPLFTSSAGGTGGNEAAISKMIQANASKKLRCPLCAIGFQSAEEFGVHAATCQGRLGVSHRGSEPSSGEFSSPNKHSMKTTEWDDVWGTPVVSQSHDYPGKPNGLVMEDVWATPPSVQVMDDVWGNSANSNSVTGPFVEDAWGTPETSHKNSGSIIKDDWGTTPQKTALAAMTYGGPRNVDSGEDARDRSIITSNRITNQDKDDESSGDERDLMQSGVTFDMSLNKYRAVVVLDGQEIDLGTFDTRDRAEEIFLRALGKWSAESSESVAAPEEEDSGSIGDAQLLEAYLRSRQGEEETDVDLELVLALLEQVDINLLESEEAAKRWLGPRAPQHVPGADDGASAVLIFLPGWNEISSLCDSLSTHPRFGNERKYLVLPLHSGIPSKEQRRVFARPPPGVRKIICATNIAETSLTIEDVVCVVDCGLVKEKGYDAFTKSSSLLPHLVSKASARQRRGRAGRCRPGVCFHLYSRRRFDTMLENQIPELLRTPLEEMCLFAKAVVSAGAQVSSLGVLSPDMTIADFLLKALDPPALKAILQAIQALVALGALDNEEQLTPMGARLSAFSVEPRVGRMILYGAFLGALVPALTLSVAQGYRDPFVLVANPAIRSRANAIRVRLASSVPELGVSDHVAILTCVREFLKAKSGDARRYCAENYLSYATLEALVSMQKQVFQQLTQSERDAQASTLPSSTILAALCCLATSPNLALFRQGRFICASHRKVRPHQGSAVNPQRDSRGIGGDSRRSSRSQVDGEDRFFVFEEICRNAGGCTLRVLTEVPALIVALFGGSLNLFDPGDDDSFKIENFQELRINAWAKVRCSNPREALMFAVLRLRLETTFFAGVSRGKFLPGDRAMAEFVGRVLVAQVGGTIMNIPPSLGGFSPSSQIQKSSGPRQLSGSRNTPLQQDTSNKSVHQTPRSLPKHATPRGGEASVVQSSLSATPLASSKAPRGQSQNPPRDCAACGQIGHSATACPMNAPGNKMGGAAPTTAPRRLPPKKKAPASTEKALQ